MLFTFVVGVVGSKNNKDGKEKLKRRFSMTQKGVVLFDKDGRQVTKQELVVRAKAQGCTPSDLIGAISAQSEDALVEVEAHFSE